MSDTNELPAPNTFWIRMADLRVNEVNNVRGRRNEAKMLELTAGLRQKGQLVPVLVSGPHIDETTQEKYFTLVDGFRRHEALTIIGKDAILVTCSMEVMNSIADRLSAGLMANLNREDMSHWDIANALKHIKEQRELDDGAPMTIADLAEAQSVSSSFVSQHLAVFKLAEAVQKRLRDDEITWTFALTLMRLATPEAQVELMEKAKTAGEAKSEVDRLEAVEVHEVEQAAAEPAEDEEGAPADDGEKGEKKPKTPRKKPAEKKSAEPSLVDSYKQAKLKPVSEKTLRGLMLDAAGKLERATSEKGKIEWGHYLRGLEAAGGLKKA